MTDVRPAVGVGIDLVDIDRLRRLQTRTPEFFRRYFSEREVAHARASADPVPRFAEAFAAKEAFLKALDLGVLDGLELREVELVTRDDGTHALMLSSRATARVGAVQPRVSVSRTAQAACAVVIVEGPMAC